jgi:hypothetical protein
MWQIAAAAAVQVVAGLMGQSAAAKDKRDAKKYMNEAAAEILKVMPPDPESQKVFFEQFRSAGILTPELEKALPEVQSEMSKVSTDPRLKDAQMSALQKLQRTAEGGLDVGDKASLQAVKDQATQQEKSQRQAILQNMAARGMAGSGAELASQMSAQQGAADRNARGGLEVAAQAQRRALEAAMQSGQLGGQIRGQDFEEQAQKARAVDAIRQFNAANSISMQQRNVDRNNNAQAANLGNAQDISNRNTGSLNQQKQINAGVSQQAYQNAMQKAQAVAAAKTAQGQQAAQQAQNTANQYAQGGSAIGQGVNAYANYSNSQDQNALLKEYLATKKPASTLPPYYLRKPEDQEY